MGRGNVSVGVGRRSSMTDFLEANRGGWWPVIWLLTSGTALAGGCAQPTDADGSGPLEVVQGASTVTPQIPLNGNAIPKFVDALPTFAGRRVDGTQTVQVTMQEFQQKVLPASVYASLPSPYNNGTYVWGYNINGRGPSWPARTIEVRQNIATSAIYTNSLVNTHLQALLTVDQSLHWADPLG